MFKKIRSLVAGALVMVERRLKRRRIYAATFRDHSVDSPPFWMSGGVGARWRGGTSTERDGRRWFGVRVDWSLFRFGLGARLITLPKTWEQQAHLSLYLPGLTLRIGYEGAVPSFWPIRQSEHKALEASITSSGWVSWSLWMRSDGQDANEPRWRRFNADVRDLIFGQEQYRQLRPPEYHKIGLPLPRGVVPVEIAESSILVKRPRWPEKRVVRRFEVRCSEVAQRAGVRPSSFSANGLPDAIGQVVEMAVKYGDDGATAWRWKQKRAHCVTCGGMGLTAPTQADRRCGTCGSSGLRPLAELTREVFNVALSAAPAVGDMLHDQQIGAAVEELALAAIASLDAEIKIIGPASNAWPLLLSCMQLQLRRGRVGVAAQMAGLALSYAATAEQEEEAQRALCMFSRMKTLAPPRLDLFPQKQLSGIDALVPVWRDIEDLARLVPEEAHIGEAVTKNLTQLVSMLYTLADEARAAGWSGAEPLGCYIAKLRADRNLLQDRISLALQEFQALLSMSIPEGREGDLLREVMPRLFAALEPSTS